MNWIDKIGYPWHLDVAEQLHLNLVKYKPANKMALLLADKATIDTSQIYQEQSPFLLWKEILEQASGDGLLRELITQVLKQMRPDHPMYKFFESVLNTGDAPLDAEPVSEDGVPNFISDDDSVTDEEALLFKEDLTLPIGKLASLISTLQKLEALAPSVCRLVVTFNGPKQYGTAFRIGKKTLLTNHHVLHSKHTDEKAAAVTAQFGYDDDGAGGELDPKGYKCDAATIESNKDNDWGIIICLEELPDSIPVIDLDKAVAPVMYAQAFIIQHPQAGTKKIGYVRNSISNMNDRIVHYLTDTQEGSSGAPVFNEAGELIALHHAGGQPTELTGKAPMKKNEGILIKKIKEDMDKQNVKII